MNTPNAGAKREPLSRGPARGFTLIETALATVIVGVGVLAMVSAQAAFHQKNSWSTHVSTAMRLGNEIREMTFNLPRHDPVTGDAYWGPEPREDWVGDYDDVDDFDGEAGNGLVFSAADGTGPINARREVIPGMAGWSQTVRVMCVDPFDITSELEDFESSMLRVEVVVHYQGPTDDQPIEITRVSWIAPK
ncbi:MAG: prepilin-type N-terminal cleavage/methylation domain-containing protein [Phycisphaerales bacterium]|nr:prepilin-type N-terminal cleavage/methylation domain-containing protein [Phycisphaerales bacterium]